MRGSSPTDAASGPSALAQAIFSPGTIALIGASSDPSKLASRPERVLRRHGYPGTIVALGSGHGGFADRHIRRPLHEFSDPIDHAFIMVPALSVGEAVAECSTAGVRVATILTAGFAERGPAGKRRQDAIVETARATGMRLIGPNSLGVIDVHAHVVLSANAVLEHEVLRPGTIGVVSQSGSMLGAIVTRAQERGLGFSKLVSVGNECDLAVGELVQLLVDDPQTEAVLLFLETFRDAPALARAARNAFRAGKPIIALKLGRSRVGRAIAMSHTGSIAGDDQVADAFFRDHAILRVTVFEALFETARLVLGHRPPDGRRIAAVTVSGGAAAMVADCLGMAGVEVVPPPPEVVTALAARRIRIGSTPIIDLPMGRADGGSYAAVVEELLASDHCDAVLAVQGSNATYMPASVRERILPARSGRKPLAVFVGPRGEEALRILQENGVAAFRTPESCADALHAFCAWRRPADPVRVDGATATAVRRAIGSAGHGSLNEQAASKLLAALGIPFAHAAVVQSGDQSIDLPFPVVAKVLSPDIPHKTEAQGVVLDIPTEQVLGTQVEAILKRSRAAFPQARIEGVLVQTRACGLAEVIIGFRRDRDVGPVVAVGPGGMTAELRGAQAAVRLAPISEKGALEMIESAPGLELIRGYRGRPRGDLNALAAALHRLSLLALAASPFVVEAEINPLIVRADGVIAVDALVRLESE